jgi:DNA topoisomerase-3
MRHAPPERILRRALAETVVAAARDFEGPLGVRVEDKRQAPPRLHDLPSLQKLCSARFGWSAAKTLEVAQELYDGQGKKIITYPRAEVRYLPESLIADVPRIVAGLQVGQSFKAIPVPDPPVIRRGANGTFHDKGLEGASHHAVIPNVNTIDTLREVWPRLSIDEKRLFDVIARAWLAALMPDFRYRQTTATLDVKGFPFKATGRQPIELGWRAAFPEWQPADEKDEAASLLPALRDGEPARLLDPAVEAKETKPPPRYSEGTLIEAMQNAWRFVEDEVLRDRLKEAKGIGTPATRAEIIGGLKKQDFLIAHGKTIVPTETGPETVRRPEAGRSGAGRSGRDGATRMPARRCRRRQAGDDGAVDAVCDVALRIIGKLTQGQAAGGPPLLGMPRGSGGGTRPPTPAMKRFAVTLARQKRTALPAGYATSASICRAFLDQHAPRKAAGGPAAGPAADAAAAAHGPAAEGSKPSRKRRPRKEATAAAPARKPSGRGKTSRKPKPGAPTVNAGGNTPLKIPYGNKDVALKLGARYAAGGWYAPPGTDLSAFRENGWL